MKEIKSFEIIDNKFQEKKCFYFPLRREEEKSTWHRKWIEIRFRLSSKIFVQLTKKPLFSCLLYSSHSSFFDSNEMNKKNVQKKERN